MSVGAEVGLEVGDRLLVARHRQGQLGVAAADEVAGELDGVAVHLGGATVGRQRLGGGHLARHGQVGAQRQRGTAGGGEVREHPPGARLEVERRGPPPLAASRSGWTCWKPVRSRRTTIRCRRLPCSTSYAVTGAPSGPLTVNDTGTPRPADATVSVRSGVAVLAAQQAAQEVGRGRGRAEPRRRGPRRRDRRPPRAPPAPRRWGPREPAPSATAKTATRPTTTPASRASVLMGEPGRALGRLLDGCAHGGVVEGLGAGDSDGAGLEGHLDVLDPVDLLDLLGHGGDAVAARHAGDGVGAGDAHGGPSGVSVGAGRSGGGRRGRRCRRTRPLDTPQGIASPANRIPPAVSHKVPRWCGSGTSCRVLTWPGRMAG